jgi:hypothetical protein
VTIQLTAPALRRAADMLDRLAAIEAETDVTFDGAYNGHIMISIGNPEGDVEALKLVRLPAETSGNVIAEAAYALEFEVP